LNEKLKDLKFEGIDLLATFNRDHSQNFQLNIRGQLLTFSNGAFNFNGMKLPTMNQKKVSIRVLLDRTTIEIFIDNGFSVLSTYAVSAPENGQISIESDETIPFNVFEVHQVGSIWQ